MKIINSNENNPVPVAANNFLRLLEVMLALLPLVNSRIYALSMFVTSQRAAIRSAENTQSKLETNSENDFLGEMRMR